MVKRGWKAENERKKILEEDSWHCTRNSGSIGASDLVAIRKVNYRVDFPRNTFEVRYEQVKSVRGKIFYFNKRSKSELERLKEIQKKFGITCFFSIKFKRYGWKIIDIIEIDGKPIRFNMESNEISY